MASMTTGSNQTDKNAQSGTTTTTTTITTSNNNNNNSNNRTGGPPKSTTSSSSSSKSSSAEDEFLIAADLTLYANPLRCLQPKKSTNPANRESAAKSGTSDKGGGGGSGRGGAGGGAKAVHNTKGTSDESGRYNNDCNTMIAADLIKYGSPLDG